MGNEHDIITLLRKALKAQQELGYKEVVMERPGAAKLPDFEKIVASAAAHSAAQTSSHQISVKDAMTGKQTEASVNTPGFSSLEEHNQKICDCQKCPLGQSRNKFVYGVGNPNADVMFIGEAPGADEDRKGEPFVGRAGQLLDKIMAAIQLSRETAYIANILKCRPPQNRDPQPNEMELCFPYLHEQIRIIKPKLICALGRIAAQAVLNTTTPLGKLRNRWHEFEGVPTIITYHPAALLRFPGYKRDTWEDMKQLKARLDSLQG